MEKYSLNKTEKINPIKYEYLRDGVKPITSCLCNKDELDAETKEMIENYKKNADGVSKISECNDHNKWSEESFLYCTGTIISGIEKNTNKNISIMIHRNPSKFLEYHTNNTDVIRENFLKKISESIKDIKERCEPKTIDCVIFGGNDGDDLYKKSITILGEICSKELGFEPVVLTGPKISSEIINKERLNFTDIYFDNDNRRIFVVRTQQKSTANESYLPSEIKKQSKKW
ncbi:MAG TPA: hypothetical protein PKZ36_00145 [Candidatus Paceibacterota bacterium]|nr:hypothetical protein [Candidatus Paceibacterota bacterium]HPT17814.1 hypothetical protein [Candidatus Paceibacterota bacterium]